MNAVRDVNEARWWKPETFLIQPYDATDDPLANKYFNKPHVKQLLRVTRGIDLV